VVVVAVYAGSLGAALPNARLLSIHPPGGQRGKNVEVKIRGTDLDDVGQLRFSHPGITAVQKIRDPRKGENGPQPVANRFVIKIAASLPVGIYEVRAVGRFGVSTSRSFMVGDRPETIEKEPNDTHARAAKVNVGQVINGRSNRAGDLDFYRFSARQGERILINCYAERIDSRLEPMLTVYDMTGRPLAECRDTFRHDALLDFTAPADGDYLVKVNDLTYNGNLDYFYRLVIGSGPQIVFVFPPAGIAGTQGQFTLYGRNLPGGTLTDRLVNGKPLERLDVTIKLPSGPEPAARIENFQRKRLGVLVTAPSASTEGFEYRLQTDSGESNPVFIGFATAPVVREREPNDTPDKAQQVTVPAEIAGQFGKVSDRDWFSFQAKKGDVFQIEVISQRLGIATDPFLVIQQVVANGKAKDLAEVDDPASNSAYRRGGPLHSIGSFAFNTRNSDPTHRFVAPANAAYRVMVRDLYFTSRGDSRAVYRLSIRREKPHFRLVALSHYPEDLSPMNRQRHPWTPVLRRGGTEQIDVLAFRWDGFNGDVHLTIEGLPKGVTCSGTICRTGRLAAPLVLRAAEDAAPWNGPIRIVGTATIAGKTQRHVAEIGTVIWYGQVTHSGCRARGMRELYLSVIDESSSLRVEAGGGKTWKVKPGTKLKVPIKIVRRGGFKGPVQLIPIYLPGKVTSKVTSFAANKSEGVMELTIGKGALPGEHRFFFEVKADIGYQKIAAPKAKPRRKAKPITVRSPSTMITIHVESAKKR